jgi:class 3 adenylate cyclase
VDDKGCVLIACWGMPNMSYLDNVHRALTAAAQIKPELERLHMETSVGITCADVYCGTVGSIERMEYAAIGSEVNMAARIMGKAKGRLLVGESAYKNLPKADQGRLQAIEPMKVKGKSEPLQAYNYIPSASEKVSVKAPGRTVIDIPPSCKRPCSWGCLRA